MKKFIIFILLIPYAVFCQDTIKITNYFQKDSVTGKYSVSGIVQIKNMTVKQEYIAAKSWFSSEFTGYKSVVIDVDIPDQKIIGKCTINDILIFGEIKCTVTVSFKAGKYRYEITDFLHQAAADCHPWPMEEDKPLCKQYYFGHNTWGNIIGMASIDAGFLERSLKKAMQETKKNDSW